MDSRFLLALSVRFVVSDVSVSSALAQAIADEQVVVDRAYRELDTQIAQARKTLSATEARGASGTHQARGERDAFACPKHP